MSESNAFCFVLDFRATEDGLLHSNTSDDADGAPHVSAAGVQERRRGRPHFRPKQ